MQHARRVGAAIVLLFLCQIGFSQQLRLGNNPYTVEKSAVLELQSTNQGLLFPRIADTLLINALLPPDGMVIYFTTTKQLLLRVNSSWQPLTKGSAISSLNGLTATVQTFATGAAGTDVNIVSSGTAHTFNIPDASGTARGLITTGAQTLAGSKTFTAAPIFSSLTQGSIPFIGSSGVILQNNSSLFWDAVNSRLGVGTTTPSTKLHVTGTNPLTLTGVQLGTNTSADSLLTITNGLVRKLPVSTFATPVTTGNLTETGSSILTITGGTGAVVGSGTTLQVKQASASQNGFLSSADWTTFNNKLSTVDTTNIASFSVKVRSLFGAGTGIGYNAATGVFSNTGVTSVNGNTGALTMDTTYISNFATKTRSLFSAGTGITYNAATGIISSTAASTGWQLLGNAGTVPANHFIGTTDAQPFITRTNNVERMRVDALGHVGIGVTNPANPLVVKDTLEIRRTGIMSELLFSNTSGTGDFRIGGDGGDIFWQGGGGRTLQMGSYWGMVLAGDRQSGIFPAFVNGIGNTNVIIPAQRDGSVPLGIQANSATQTANLTEWRNSSATALSVVDKSGRFGIGVTAINNTLEVGGTVAGTGVSGLRLTGLGTATTATANSKVLSVNSTGDVIVTNYPTSTAWSLTGNSSTTPATNFLGTTDAQPLAFITNNIERMRINTSGFLGVGTNNPLGRLHLSNDNSEFGNDYIFDDYGSGTSQGFFMRKARGTIASPTNVVSGDPLGMMRFSGRTNGVFNYTAGSGMDAYYKGSGTNDLTDLRLFTSNTERMRLDENGNVGIGSSTFDGTNPEKVLIDAGTTLSVNALYAKGSINSYFQINIQNQGTGTQSSSDLVATANNGTETTNFIDVGINGSNYQYQSGNPIETGKANDGYLLSAGSDFYLVNNNSAKDMIFLTGGTATTNEAMRITSGRRLGIGTTAPSTSLHIKTGTANDGGLRMENLTSASTVTTGAAVLGVDATGKVVRAKAPLYYSGTGTTATTEDVTKIWVAEFANNGTGTPTVTIPANVGFSNILSIQVTAKGGSNVANAPVVTITSNTLTSVTVRLMESNVTVIAGEGLAAHIDTSTRIYIRVEGN
jgi:hypothetical protein